MEKIWEYINFFICLILPPYLLPIIGSYLSTRFLYHHWWPNISELQLIMSPIFIYGLLSFIKDRQGFSVGLPSLLIAIPVMITLYSGVGDHDFGIQPSQNSFYWIGFICSIVLSIIVYIFYPRTSCGW